MSAFNPHIVEVTRMVTDLSNKHIGELNWATVEWKILELYNPDSWGHPIEQVVPLINFNFK